MLKKIFFVGLVVSNSIVVRAQNVGINTTGAAPAATNLLEVLSPSTTASSVAIYASHTGAITGTGYSLQAIKTGASTANVGGYFAASGATSNYAIIVPASSGNVGFGTSTPDSKAMLDVVSSATADGSMGIYAKQSGAVSGTGYCVRAEKTGASTANVGGFFSATGGTANYGIVVPSGGGNVGIGTEAPSDASLLDVSSTTKGILIPRVALTDVSTFAPVTGTGVDGLMVYSTAIPTGGSGTGFYYWSTGDAKWIKVYDTHSGGGGYTIQGTYDQEDLLDGAVYYFGSFPTYSMNGTSGRHVMYVPAKGTIKACYATFQVTGTTASTGGGETATLKIGKNGSFIGAVTVSASIQLGSIIQTYSNSSLSMSVDAGDYLEFQLTCPTWATNPTVTYGSFIIYIE